MVSNLLVVLCGDRAAQPVVNTGTLVARECAALVSERKAYPLRIGAEVLEALQRWAADELRSVNAQIEFCTA